MIITNVVIMVMSRAIRPALSRRFLLTACLNAAATRALASEATDRLLVVGDSQAQGLAAGLQRLFRRDRSFRVIDRTRIATGLIYASRFDWPGGIAEIAEAERGAVAIVMFGANDRPAIRINGAINPVLADAFETAYGAHVRAIVEGLKRFCPAVIWVGHPITRDPVYADDMAMLNRLYEANATRAGADWFPSWKLFLDQAGGYAAFGKGVDGETTRLRADDGVHLTPAGYDVLAKALAPVIAPYRAVPASG